MSSKRKRRKVEIKPTFSIYSKPSLGLKINRILEFKGIMEIASDKEASEYMVNRCVSDILDTKKEHFYPSFFHLHNLFLTVLQPGYKYFDKVILFLNSHKQNPLTKILMFLFRKLKEKGSIVPRGSSLGNYNIEISNDLLSEAGMEFNSCIEYVEFLNKNMDILGRLLEFRFITSAADFEYKEDDKKEEIDDIIEIMLMNIPVYMCMSYWLASRIELYDTYVSMGITPEIIALYACKPYWKTDGTHNTICFTGILLVERYQSIYYPFWETLPYILTQYFIPDIASCVISYLKCRE